MKRKPPVEHQFKPGQSGNPLGRPKQKPFIEWCKTWAYEEAEAYLRELLASAKDQRVKVEVIKLILAYGIGKPVETIALSVAEPAPNPDEIERELIDAVTRAKVPRLPSSTEMGTGENSQPS